MERHFHSINISTNVWLNG